MPPIPDVLITSLLPSSPQDVISPVIKCSLIQEFWNIAINPLDYHRADLNFDPYFRMFATQCYAALREGGRHVSIRTYAEVAQIVRDFRESLTREEVIMKHKKEYHPPLAYPDDLENCVNASIDLALQLFLMVDFAVVTFGFTGRQIQPWNTGTIEAFILDYFKNEKKLDSKGVRLQEVFNARSLSRIAGIKINWTINLADHLRLVDDEGTVHLFHFKSFLDANKESTTFPINFIQETQNTLSMMFPPNPELRKWIKKQTEQSDDAVLNCRRLRADERQIENFLFWHDRLVILKQIFDEAEPSTIRQWWHDRRKYVQWYTFWVAAVVLILTIFFGLAQTIAGTMQTWKAFNP